MTGTARRIMRLLEKRGLQSGDDSLARDDPLLATLMAASVRSRIATGPQAGQPWRRLGDRVEQLSPAEVGTDTSNQTPARCVRHGGMSLHADVSVPARDRKRLERLARYVLRQPMALERLEALPDGRLSYRLKTRWRDGTTHILMERRELLERLAPLIPPPRAHQVRYHGILAPCAAGRSFVVPGGASQLKPTTHAKPFKPELEPQASPRGIVLPTRPGGNESAAGHNIGEEHAALPVPGATATLPSLTSVPVRPDGKAVFARDSARTGSRRHRLSWAELLKRVFGIEALRCPHCGSRMRVLATIVDPDVAKRILACMKLPPRAPPLTPAQATAALERFETDDTGWHDPQSAGPEFEFDQTPPAQRDNEEIGRAHV